MYTEGQLAGILLTTATPKLKVIRANTRSGWTLRHIIEIRAPVRMIDGIERSLGSLFNIEPKRKPEPKRHRDMLTISRQPDIIAICNIMPDGAPAKSNAWSRFKKGMKIVENREHLDITREEFGERLNDETNYSSRKAGNGPHVQG